MTVGVRGIRNNNPGNIRISGDDWRGQKKPNTDGDFFQFVEMKWGVRAAARVIRNYQVRHDLMTIHDIIHRWAPSSENNTSAYVNAVAKRLGIRARDHFDIEDGDNWFNLLRAIFRHENGAVAELSIPDSVVREGIDLV